MTTTETLSNTIAVLCQPKTKLYDIEDILQLSCYILMNYVQTLTGKNDSMNQGKLWKTILKIRATTQQKLYY